jgi:hypothetical protein
MTNGKGDKRRPGDEEAFRNNFDRIFVKAAKPDIAVDHAGSATCAHSKWVNESYNDWGFPYFVASCADCGRRLSSPVVDVYAQMIAQH